MDKLKSMAIILLMGICFSCSYNDLIQQNSDDELTQEQEDQNLNQLFSEIESMTSNLSCNDSSEWTFTSYGNKACGGAIAYIAYSTTIDTVLFLKKIEEHRISQQEFNEKWEIISDCLAPSEPNGVLCEDGKPVLEY